MEIKEHTAADPGGGGASGVSPPPKIGKKYDFFADFSHEIPQKFSRLTRLGELGFTLLKGLRF